MGMDRRQRRREGSQRAQASRERRQTARKQRKSKNILYGLGGVVAVAVVVVLVVLLQGGGPDVGYSTSAAGGAHRAPYIYTTEISLDDGRSVRVPPSGGNHLPNRSAYGFLGGPVTPEAAVHNMEHGAIVIWYEPNDPEVAGQVNQLVRQLGGSCIVAGEFLAMDTPVSVTAWGHVLPLDVFDAAQIREFADAYRGNTGPEAGICRGES
ncbi:MAG: DUF3105 domain-containing protein [Dehalococcoidia bacterium]